MSASSSGQPNGGRHRFGHFDDRVSGEPDQSVEDPALARSEPVVLELVSNPVTQAAYPARGLQRQFSRHVHVVEVDRRRDWYVGPSQLISGIKRWPVIAFGQQFGGFPERPQRRVLVDYPGVNHLAREQQWGPVFYRRLGRELGELGAHPLRGPPGRWALGVTSLVDQRIQGRRRVGQLALHRDEERVAQLGASEWVFQQVVQRG